MPDKQIFRRNILKISRSYYLSIPPSFIKDNDLKGGESAIVITNGGTLEVILDPDKEEPK